MVGGSGGKHSSAFTCRELAPPRAAVFRRGTGGEVVQDQVNSAVAKDGVVTVQPRVSRPDGRGSDRSRIDASSVALLRAFAR